MPELREKEGGFIVTLFKDRFSKEELQQLGLTLRQINAVQFIKDRGKITNSEYQEINEVIDRTALRDLDELIEIGIIKKVGEKKGAYYELITK